MDESAKVACSECGATDVPLEFEMCAECCEVDGAFGYPPPIIRTRKMIDYAKYEGAQAEITTLRARVAELEARAATDADAIALRAVVQSLTAERDALREALQWIADNTGRDTWLSQFERRFDSGDVPDLLAAIDAARAAGERGNE